MKFHEAEAEEEAENPFWITYSDLLSSLLLVFLALLFAFQALTMIQAEQLRIQKKALEKKQQQVEIREKDLKKDRELLDKFVEEINRDIVKKHRGVTVAKNGEVTIETGNAWFEAGKETVLPDARHYLEEIIPIYVEVITRDEYKNCIQRILVEGHADLYGPDEPNWDKNYRSNLTLSLKRGESVSLAILDITNKKNHAKVERLRNMLTVGGRSNIQLRIDNFGEKIPGKTAFQVEYPKYRCVKLRLDWRNPSLGDSK